MAPCCKGGQTPRSWQRTEELFHAAAERPSGERRPFLLAACDGDSGWIEEIESLLAAEAGADQRIEGVIADTLELASRIQPNTAENPVQVGPYRILHELGCGGMSTVYLAERADEHYRQLVALKVVKRGMDSGEILRRLRQERQILAHLEHPHISRLLDGGNTAEGLPYFVMEYVDGEPIDQYCQRLGLSIEARLALFQEVLDAVAYAHRNLVVHRDLKPANILVTGNGEVKLLDFGIAKLLDPEQAAELGATSATLRFFTLDYSSPEQILGKTLTTASDVYSLGVLLYELLTTSRPHDGASGRRQKEQAICDSDPPAPSQRIAHGEADDSKANSKALQRRLQGDLDAIVLNALQRQENRRYASVDHLAEDLRRHLQGLPVHARQDTLTYRCGKFLRRHRLGVSSVLVVALTLISLVTFYTVRLASERNRAQIESRKSSQVAVFLRGLFENADPGRVRGPQVTAQELLSQGAARIDAELADQPEVRAELMDLMGSVYSSLGLNDEADPLLRVSEQLRREHLGAAAEATLASRLHRGQWLHAVGDYGAAEDLFRDLLEISEPEISGSLWAEILEAYGDLLYDLERSEEAGRLFRQSLDIHRTLYGDEHRRVATSLHNLGATLYLQDALEAAEAPLRQALKLRQRLLGAHHPDVATTLSTLGVLRFARQDASEGTELLQRALSIRRRLYSEDHPLIATTLNNLGELARRQGNLDAAVDYLSESLEITRRGQGTEHPAYADSLANLARAVQMRGDADQAVDLYHLAVAATRHAYGEDNGKLVSTLQFFGDGLRTQGDLQGAQRAYTEALDMQRRRLEPGHWSLSFPLLRLGRSRLESGDPATAEALLVEAFEIRQQQRPGHWRAAEAESWLGSCLFALGRQGEGRRLLESAVEELETALGEDAPATIEARRRLQGAPG